MKTKPKTRTRKTPFEKKKKGQQKQTQKSVKVSGKGSNKATGNSNKFNSNEPEAAVIEYLKYFPFNSKSEVTKFYERVDREWGDIESGTNLLDVDVKSSKKVNSINEVLDAMKKAKKTTFCDRKNGNGDCEDTADEVLKLIKNVPSGKYKVESHRIVYYMEEEDEYNEAPEFVQNHGFVVFYPIKGKNREWFKYGQIKFNRKTRSSVNSSLSDSSRSSRSSQNKSL